MSMESRIINEVEESKDLRYEAMREVNAVLLRYAQNLQNEISALEQMLEELTVCQQVGPVMEIELKDMLNIEIKRCQIDARYYEDRAEFINNDSWEEQ